MYQEPDFISHIDEAYQIHLARGPRVRERLIPITSYIGDYIQEVLGDEYEVVRDRYSSASGLYFDKNVPILVKKDGVDVLCVGCKFVTSNYNQNANNYFQSLLGEAANIQSLTASYAQIFILPRNIPYKRRAGQVREYQSLEQAHFVKYLNLYLENDFVHRPLAIGTLIVDIDYERNIVQPFDIGELFTADFADSFNNKLSIANFFTRISNI